MLPEPLKTWLIIAAFLLALWLHALIKRETHD
jgi:hypothetical protein